jgi:hypothetical protein
MAESSSGLETAMTLLMEGANINRISREDVPLGWVLSLLWYFKRGERKSMTCLNIIILHVHLPTHKYLELSPQNKLPGQANTLASISFTIPIYLPPTPKINLLTTYPTKPATMETLESLWRHRSVGLGTTTVMDLIDHAASGTPNTKETCVHWVRSA